MPKPDNQWQAQAAEAAARIDADREMGVQLALIPDPAEPRLPARRATGGRPAGAKNKGSSQLRKWLADQGLKMPEQQIAEIAGLAAQDSDAMGTAMAQAERLIAWATDGAGEIPVEGRQAALIALRIDLFKFLYSSMRQAADALMPYGTPKASPDVVQNTTVNMIVPSAPSQPGDQARVINAPKGGRMAPPPLPGEIVENQDLSGSDPEGSDAESRTE